MLAENFFLGYRKVDLQPHEVLLRVLLPWTRPHELVREFKQSHRQDDDIAIVNAGMRMRLQQGASGEACWSVFARHVHVVLVGSCMTSSSHIPNPRTTTARS